MNPTALQKYEAKKRGILPPDTAVGPGDAEFIDADVYASPIGAPTEVAPTGLVDRLSQENMDALPMGDPRRKGIMPQAAASTMPTRLPTTRGVR